VDLAFRVYRIEFIGVLGAKGPHQLKDVVIIGGPNGAGKSSVPQRLDIHEFVNADEIARGLSPFNPTGPAIAAGRLMLERIQGLVQNGESFAFETTCSGRAHGHWLRECKARGWRVTLVFLWLPTPQAALDRVAKRVRGAATPFPVTW
jgi:predicted ABC-type ATPase